MRVSYNKLWKLLIDKEMKKSQLREAVGASKSTFVLRIFQRGDSNGKEETNGDVSVPATTSQMAKKAMLLSENEI